MIIKGNLTLLFNSDGLHIEIADDGASLKFVDLKIAPEDVCKLLSRQAQISCNIEVKGLEKVGKKMEWKKLEFEIPKDTPYKEEDNVAKEYAYIHCPEGWTPETYFGSRDSYFTKDGKSYARCIIRRWI
jgi:hypothetical protein